MSDGMPARAPTDGINDLRPDQTDRALRLFHIQAMALGLYWAGAQPSSLTMADFSLNHIGFTKETAGIVSAVVCAAGLAQIASGAVLRRVRRKARAVALIGSMEMVVLALVLLLPRLLPGTEHVRLRCGLFLALLLASAVCLHLVSPPLSNWLSVLVPVARRGRYLSVRMLLQSVVMVSVAFAAGQALHYSHSAYGVIAGIILFCCAGGIVGYVVLARAPVPTVSLESQYGLRDLVGTLRHRPFRQYMIFTLLVNGAFAGAVAWYAAFFLEEVRITRQQIAFYGLAYSVVRLATIRSVGTLVDRWGARPLLKLMVLIYAAFFFAFPFFRRETYPLIVAAFSVAAVGDAIFGVAVPSTLYQSLPHTRGRAAYFAVERVLTLAVYAVGPLAVTAYLHAAGGLTVRIGGLEVEKFRLMFAVCGVMVLSGFLAIRSLPDTHEVALRHALVQLFRSNLIAMVRRPWRQAPPSVSGTGPRRSSSD